MVEHLKIYSCLVLFKILSNTLKESNSQSCVLMEWLLLSRVWLELSGLELALIGAGDAVYCVL